MLELFNTLSKKIEPLEPSDGKTIRMYTCGPTVYDFAHIGNLRSFIMPDLLYRTLKSNGQNVEWVMNLTDIDDKTIKGAIEKFGPEASVEDLQAYTQEFTDGFLADLKKVNVSVEDIRMITVTSVIPEIQAFILQLIEKGYAYKAEDGSTYFSIEKYQTDFKDYGSLVGEKFLEGKKIGARVQVDEYDKDNLSDFALWKAHTPEDANIFWDHPEHGRGRPGWHIECSVINRVAFGEKSIDLHTGGVDLIFPHHTNEIAQSQPLGPFVKHWMHIEHILVDNKKMSKSLNNFYTLKNLEEKGFNGLDLRYLYLQSHYKTQQNFTWDSLQASHTALQKLRNADRSNSSDAIADFMNATNDDLNTPAALAFAWEDKANLSEYDIVLGLNVDHKEEIEIPEQVYQLLELRRLAREEKDFSKSDRLREEIEQFGFEVKDTAEGQQIKKA